MEKGKKQVKMAAGIMECIKVETPMHPNITISKEFYFLWAFHIMPDTEQPKLF